MKSLLTIITLFFFQTLLGQTKTFSNVTFSNGDTSFWYKYQNIVIHDLSLTRLDTSSSDYYFRIWKANQVLDIWKTNYNTFYGQLTSWATEQTPAKEKPTDRILVVKKILHSDTIKQLIKLIEKSEILNLPTDDSIKGWKHGFDGITYIIEFATKSNYNFKTYWTPKVQDSTLIEARYFQSFVDTIFRLSNSSTIWKDFEKLIPYECYNVGGTIGCKVLTKKQKRQFEKERKKYRQQNVLSQQN